MNWIKSKASVSYIFSIKQIYQLRKGWHFFLCCFSMFPKSTHETFAQKLYQTFKVNKRFTKPKLSQTDFMISHYAGEVRFSSSIYWFTEVEAMVIFYRPKHVLFVHNIFSGYVSSWSVSRQKQRLCGTWASGTIEQFKMFFCWGTFPSGSWRISQIC